jgi:hypothetical protein
MVAVAAEHNAKGGTCPTSIEIHSYVIVSTSAQEIGVAIIDLKSGTMKKVDAEATADDALNGINYVRASQRSCLSNMEMSVLHLARGCMPVLRLARICMPVLRLAAYHLSTFESVLDQWLIRTSDQQFRRLFMVSI